MTTNEAGTIASDVGGWRGAAWGDYDNDGWLELYLTQAGAKRALYHNDGNGRFIRILTNSPLVTDVGFAEQPSWGDYDGEGFLDLFVATGD